MNLLTEMVLAAVVRLSETGGGSPLAPSLVIDLLDLQWWQLLLGITAAAGLSPAPWLLGLARNKIQFTGPADAAHQKQLAEAEEAHDRELAARDAASDRERQALIAYHATLDAAKDQRYADLEVANQRNIEAAEAQRVRADTVTEALTESSQALKMTSHILQELKRSAEEVTPSDGQPELTQ
jgi:hypothetical protein